MNKNTRFVFRSIGVAFEILGILAGLGIPIVFTVIIPIIKTMDYYSSGGTGVAVIVKTTLASTILAPILAVVIFTPLFLIGAMLYTVFEDKEEEKVNEDGERIVEISESQLRDLALGKQQQQNQDSFYIFKDNDPSRSDAAIAELNWRLSHQESDKDNKNEIL